MPDGQAPLILLREGNQVVALIELQAHGLFEQHVAARFERRFGRFVVQVRRHHNVHRFQLFPLEHLAVIGVKRRAGVFRLGGGAGRF